MLIREAEKRLRELGFLWYGCEDDGDTATAKAVPMREIAGDEWWRFRVKAYMTRYSPGAEKVRCRKRLAAERLVEFVEGLREVNQHGKD